LLQWLDELLGRLLGGATQGIFDGRYVIVALGIVLLAGVLVYFLLNLRRNVVDEAALPATLPSDETNLTSTAALGHAQRLALAVLVLFAILIGFTVVSSRRRAEIQQQSETPLPYSTNSALPNGTLALQMWLAAIGYQSRRAEGDAFLLPDEARVLFVFPAASS